MLILDTNVLSAIMQSVPPAPVAAFIAAQPIAALHTATVCQAEILAGLGVMPTGKRRTELEAAARAMFLDDFEGRVLAFDGPAAVAYGNLYALRQRAGRPASTVDLMIAAIARVHGAGVVTRDKAGFEGCGLTVIDPWTAAGESLA